MCFYYRLLRKQNIREIFFQNVRSTRVQKTRVNHRRRARPPPRDYFNQRTPSPSFTFERDHRETLTRPGGFTVPSLWAARVLGTSDENNFAHRRRRTPLCLTSNAKRCSWRRKSRPGKLNGARGRNSASVVLRKRRCIFGRNCFFITIKPLDAADGPRVTLSSSTLRLLKIRGFTDRIYAPARIKTKFLSPLLRATYTRVTGRLPHGLTKRKTPTKDFGDRRFDLRRRRRIYR